MEKAANDVDATFYDGSKVVNSYFNDQAFVKTEQQSRKNGQRPR